MPDARAGDVALYRRLLQQAKPFRAHLVGIFLLTLSAVPLALLTPLPLKIAVDNVLDDKPLPRFLAALLPAAADSLSARLGLAIGMLIGIALLVHLQGLAVWVLQTYTGERLLLQFRSQLFRHAQRLSLAYHDRLGSSDAIYRIQYDAQSVQNLAINGVAPFLTASMTLVAMLAVIVRVDWQLALVAAAVVPVLFWLVRASRGRLRGQWDAIKQFESSAMAVIQETISALRVVKAFGQEDREADRFVRHAKETMWNQMRLAFTEGTFDLCVGLTIASAMAGALFLGLIHVRSNVITLGELLLIMAYMTQLLTPIQTITKRVAQLQGAFAGAARAFAVLDQAPDVADRAGARAIARATGAVSCRNVSFGYEKELVLRDVTIDVPAGSRVGIAGRTGAGKTTFANLLARFYDPTSGAILLDGIDLRDYRLADLRNQFAIVLQEPVLFSTSIGENIAYARPEATREEIIAAARAANAHDFIARLPEGYDTPVGERGVLLSGGERQRISLARAFLKDAPMLLLDEPTSAVDVETENAIMEAMDRLMSGRTTFMIAHRLNTLERCDVRLVLDRGHVMMQSSVGAARLTV